MRMILLLVVVVMLSTFPLALDEAEAAPNPIPLATVWFDSDIYRARVLPYSPTVVVMYGNVIVEKSCGIERVVVHLAGESDSGWPFEIRPAEIPFINPGTQRFTVVITIPPGALPQLGIFTTTAAVKAPGLAKYVTSSTCIIETMPMYLSYLEPIGSQCVLGGDGLARFPVRVWNLGNAEDAYTFDLSPGTMPLMDWDDPEGVTVPPRSFVETIITVHYEENRYPSQIWSAELTIRSSLTHIQNEQFTLYMGGPSSSSLWVYDEGPAMGPILGIDMSAGMTVMIIQLAILVSVLAAYRLRPRTQDGRNP